MNQNGTICSDHGLCECGKCRCDAGFRGALCDTCLSCPDLCEGHFNCVECVGFKQGPFNDKVCKERCENVEIVPILYNEEYNLTEYHKFCILRDTSGCLIYFNIYDAGSNRSIQIKSRKRCPQRPIDPLPLGLGISGAVVVVGITLIIIWKILSLISDRMEYSKFEAEIKEPIWKKAMNPIYMECSTTTQNPIRNYSRLNTGPDNHSQYEETEQTPVEVHKYVKLEGIEEKESDIPETPSKYDKIDKTRVSTRK